MSSIREFAQRERPEDYGERLLSELVKLNGRLHAFNNIAPVLGDGMPFSVKDNLCVKGVESTASSKILKGYLPAFSATAVQRMQDKGFSFLGKTNMDEFGFGSWGTNSANVALNPFDEEYVAGGSSSGAAVATSVLKYHVAIAESTGGSIATPAAFCGVVGFTPTYGAVSRYGLIDYANSLDKIGVMARHADDARQVFDIMRGRDGYDTTCIDVTPVSEDKKKVFLIKQMLKGLDKDVESNFMALVDKVRSMGYKVEEKSLEILDKAIATYYIIAMAETSTNLARYTGFKYGFKNERFDEPYNKFFTEARGQFGSEAKRRIVLGTFVRSASVRDKYYEKALKVRRLLLDKLNGVLSQGFILSPVMPMKTPRLDEVQLLSPLETYKMDVLTVPPNLCGLPHVSFPYAYHKGMPMGAQLIAEQWDDYALLDFVGRWEKSFVYRFKYNLGAL